MAEASKTVNKVNAGELLVFTDGACSEYKVTGVYSAKQDFNAIEMRDAWMKESAAEDRANVYPGEFVEWLMKTRGLIEPEDAREFFLGSYGFDDMEVFDVF